ncbi:4Fe-4S binding protein [Nocardia vinacea]|uniref:4Fe-4S binding protein n=1 Tax=Nocardia vinacea TaxID=96468 RepID=A0ABZ1YT69_9NOCA|nr:4Fe-4S binding protein [Nocardia vinacea]
MLQTSAVVRIDADNCVGCQRCVSICPTTALSMDQRLAVVDEDKCVGCFKCIEACAPFKAISVLPMPTPRVLTTPSADDSDPAVNEICRKARMEPDAVICVCTRTTAREVAAALLSGVREIESIPLATGAGAKCGMWCHAALVRMLRADGITVEPTPRNRRFYADSGAGDIGIWSISDEVAERYPEYRLKESRDAVEDGTIHNEPTPMFPEILPTPDDRR